MPLRLIENLLGSNRLCHQAVVYRRAALNRVGPFSTKYKLAADYEHHFRCYAAGLRTKVVDATLVEYDTGGSSRDSATACAEFRQIQKSLAPRLPAWVNAANTLLAPIEPVKNKLFCAVQKTPMSGVLKKAWLAWNNR